MASASFDALSFARALEAAGVEPRHAEAHAKAVAPVFRILLIRKTRPVTGAL